MPLGCTDLWSYTNPTLLRSPQVECGSNSGYAAFLVYSWRWCAMIKAIIGFANSEIIGMSLALGKIEMIARCTLDIDSINNRGYICNYKKVRTLGNK